MSGAFIPDMKSLSEIIQKLWPRLDIKKTKDKVKVTRSLTLMC